MIGLYFTEIILVFTGIVSVQGSCEDGYWGSVCSKTCPNTCKTNRCSSFTGSCEECHVGWWGPKCQYPCPSKCLGNICSQFETCTYGCNTGFYGSICIDECPANCKINECDFDGSCRSGCKAGYYGNTCAQECIGTACVNNECFQNNGICMASCPDTCSSCSSIHACTTCKSGFFRPTCDTECSDTNCLECDKITGVCTECKSGYYGPTCDYECSDTNCLECDKITGVCSECGTGFYWSGSLCLQCTIGCTECTGSGNCNECIDGYFNVSNSQRCEKCQPSCKTCTSANQCTACVDGYYGLICNNACMDSCLICSNLDNCTTCAEYRYSSKGNSRSLTCDCDQQRCVHHVDTCLSCSNPSWYPSGPGCCPCGDGSYIDNSACVQCSEQCLPQGQCNQTNGACGECRSGYFGNKCEHQCSLNCLQTDGGLNCKKRSGACDACKAGFYGSRCTEVCSEGCGVDDDEVKWCRRDDGACQYGCLVGFTGRNCSESLSSGQEPTDTGAIVGVVIGSIGCVTLLVIAAVLILRKKQPLCQKSDSPEDSNEQGNAENTDPTLSQYEDLRYRPGNDMLYGHLGIENSTGEENAIRPLYGNVQESDVNETNTPGVRLYENLVL